MDVDGTFNPDRHMSANIAGTDPGFGQYVLRSPSGVVSARIAAATKGISMLLLLVAPLQLASVVVSGDARRASGDGGRPR